MALKRTMISIEHVYIFILLTLVVVLFTYINIMRHHQPPTSSHHESKIIVKEQQPHQHMFNLGTRPSIEDVLLDPHRAPLRDDRLFPNVNVGGACGGSCACGGGGCGCGRGRGIMPINVPTQSVNSTYRQVGILTRGDTILPLMGKPLFTNRDKWNFYTMNDKNNMIKLPLSNKGKSCTNEYGCDNIYNGDTVYVEGYNNSFTATVYDNQVMQYIPFL